MVRTACISFLFPLLMSIHANSAEVDTTHRSPLIVFHIDFNSVALNESYLRKWLLKASEMGYNAILWEVEDKVQWQSCPECVNPDAFSKESFKEILSYSRSLGLEPIPLFQTVGHAEYVLRNEKYFAFREDPEKYDCYATCDPKLRKFIAAWIEEYLDLFGDIRFFHLGGDEAYEFATSPACHAEVLKKGKGRVYAEYMAEIARPLLKKGIRPCIWNDQIMKYPEAISEVPKKFVFWDWNYWDGDSVPGEVMVWDRGKRVSREEVTAADRNHFPEIIDEKGNLRAFYTSNVLRRLGYDVVLCSSSRSSGDAVFAVRQSLHASNIVGAARKAVQEGLLGTCVTSWAIRIPSYETQQTLLCLAPLTVKHSTETLGELRRRGFEYTFGLSDSTLVEAMEKIGSPFPLVDLQSTGIQWTGMKDSRPAPPGYIKGMISKWKSDGSRWAENLARVRASGPIISEGTRKLNECIPRVTRGFDVLEDWQKAGYFMTWGSVIANDVVARADGRLQSDRDEIVHLLKDLRSDYRHWLYNWMTPHSAEINAGLVYDAITEYFEDRNP